MTNFGDAIVLILIWGVVVFGIFFYALPKSDGESRLSAFLLSIFGGGKAQENVILVSEDGGKRFRSAVVHLSEKPNVFNVKISPADSGLVFAASDFGLLISRDGGNNWYDYDPKNIVKIDKNYASGVRGLEVSDNNLYLGLSDGRILVYSLKENSWKFIDSGVEKGIISAIEILKNKIIVGTGK